MVWGDRTRMAAVTALITLTLAGVAGCSTDSSGALSLAETKSPVQLLRNEAASRIPPAVIDAVSDTEDHSVGCEPESEDPAGLRRSWHSNTRVTVVTGSVWRVDQVVDDIGQSFADQGWTVTPVTGDDDTHAVELTKKGSASEIRVSAHRSAVEATAEPDSDVGDAGADADPVTIDVETHGPCVDTEGPDSDAVRKLEAQD
jgi:hypothetical protein